jgi:pimeloyl-ACP methyl ester carboxylesterase
VLIVAGSSYGTVLGMTFAAMFPERIDRMMLDATVNPHEYMAGTTKEMLSDADKAYSAFLEECMAAPGHCLLSGAAEDVTELSNAINGMLDQVLHDRGAQLYREIKNDIIYRGLYWPNTWADLASKLREFMEGDFSSLEADALPLSEPFEYNKGGAAIFGTRCGDSALRAPEASDLTDLILQHAQVSSFADVNMATSMTCAAWNITAAERYTGNFAADTSHPILFVNGMYDPAAPLVSAMNASTSFIGSRVLLHESYGVSEPFSQSHKTYLTFSARSQRSAEPVCWQSD